MYWACIIMMYGWGAMIKTMKLHTLTHIVNGKATANARHRKEQACVILIFLG